MQIPLREIAHARAGDKGNLSSISVWVTEPRYFEQVKAQLTPERIKAAYPSLIRGLVERYELDRLCGLNFVLHDAIEGGVNSSLNLDSHGKSWSFLILALEVELTDSNLPRSSTG